VWRTVSTVLAPLTAQPAFERLSGKNWLTLARCCACHQLWVGIPYEPYASFIYQVAWSDRADNWSALVERDEGKGVVDWAEAQIKATWQQLESADRAAIEQHRRRSFGRNPIDRLP
jgi:hypothetical protein